MARAASVRRLAIWMNGASVGTWTLGRNNTHTFAYDDRWLSSAAARPISLSMPLRPSAAPYTGTKVEAWFDNLLPDSAAIRSRIQARFGAASGRAFDLLAEVGRDCVGAVQLLPEGDPPVGIDRIDGEPLDEAGVADILRSTPAATGIGRTDADEFRISLAGAQEKTALLWHDGRWHRPGGATPSTHIFKLPMGRVGNMQADFSTSVENEWLCARIVRAFGLPVADCSIGVFEDQKALVVTRFDRRLATSGDHWLRLPQEDLCQATATPPALRYESDGGPGIAQAMELLLGSVDAEQDRLRFFKTQLVFWLLCATDGHAKNFSVHLLPGGGYRLAPLYDVLSAHPILGHSAGQLAPEKATMAMAALSKDRHYRWTRILPRHWDSTARRCGLPETSARRLRVELAEQASAVVSSVADALPPDFPEGLAASIFAGVEAGARSLAAQ